MSNRYARVANAPDHQEIDDEVQAAFDYREDDDDDQDPSESRPLNPNAAQTTILSMPRPQAPSHGQSTYNFESVDYDFPPPGSPPPPSSSAFPNEIGNSNGLVPTFDQPYVPNPRGSWWKRAASSVLPASLNERLGLDSQRPAGRVGGGLNNDGVFANVVAKPTAPVRILNSDGVYVVPEDAQDEAPPSYSAAQADAVPPYWETTVHAPFAPDSMGEMIVDSLPTGSLFSFCWNMLVSISFQFVGFLLTYLLHTSHAARLGSRAGLGVTLIQYGFALRNRMDNMDSSSGGAAGWESWKPTTSEPQATSSGPDFEAGFFTNSSTTNATGPGGISQQQAILLADATTEWVSFFLMTIGWFVLLTSLLGFYRIKRWERSIYASQQTNRDSSTPAPPTAALSSLEHSFSLSGMSRIELLRSGLGQQRETRFPSQEDQIFVRVEAGQRNQDVDAQETDVMITQGTPDPSRPQVAQVLEAEANLRTNLRAAGLM